MRFLLALHSSTLGAKPYCGFADSYHGITVERRFIGSFGWFWIKALRELGHHVDTVALDHRFTALDHSSLSPWWGVLERRSGLRDLQARRAGRRLVAAARRQKPDIILIDSGYQLQADDMHALRELGIPVVTWLLDDPLRQGWTSIIETFPLYDCIFTFDPAYVQPYRSAGARRAVYLPCACDADIYHPIEPPPDHRYDLAFVGTLTRARSLMLPRLTGFNLNVWTWKPRGSLPPALGRSPAYRGKAFGEDINRIYNESRVVLNFHHEQSLEGTNMRTFEASAAGAFQLVDHRAEIDRLFPGGEIVTFRSFDELSTKARYFIDHPAERRERAAAAAARVREGHTFRHRFLEMVKTLKSL